MNSSLLQQKNSRNKWEILFLIWVAFFLNQADRQAFPVFTGVTEQTEIYPHIKFFFFHFSQRTVCLCHFKLQSKKFQQSDQAKNSLMVLTTYSRISLVDSG